MKVFHGVILPRHNKAAGIKGNARHKLAEIAKRLAEKRGEHGPAKKGERGKERRATKADRT